MVRRAHLIVTVEALLIGCAVLLVVDDSGAHAEATGEQGPSDRCEGTRFISWPTSSCVGREKYLLC